MGNRRRFLYCCMAELRGRAREGRPGEGRPAQARGREAERRRSSEAPGARAKKSRYGPCSTRTADRHRWAGASAPRPAGEALPRNSAKWPRNFGRRGACREAGRRERAQATV